MHKARGNDRHDPMVRGVLDALPFEANAEWLQQAVEGQASLYVALCNLTARRLRAQAELLESIAHGNGTPDLFDLQAQFIWSSWQDYADEAERLRKTWLEPLLNVPASPATAGKRVHA